MRQCVNHVYGAKDVLVRLLQCSASLKLTDRVAYARLLKIGHLDTYKIGIMGDVLSINDTIFHTHGHNAL